MWPNFDGKPYTRAELAAHINACDFSKWKRKDGTIGRPAFITLHNTSSPDIKLWMSWLPQKRQQYIRNMQPYYEGLGWRGGPHFFVPPQDDICAFGFNDLMAAGTHASCFNNLSIGIEMVGEFDNERFDTGPGAQVADNSIYLMALLHNKIGITPVPYAYDQHGLHFHVECKRDNHDCPGSFVRKPDVVARVQAKMAELAAPVVAAAPMAIAAMAIAPMAVAPMAAVAAAAPAPIVLPAEMVERICQAAATSDLARYNWAQRGRAPLGYTKGMAVVFGLAYQKWKAGDPIVTRMAAADTNEPPTDALSWYQGRFQMLNMGNSTAGADTLRHLFVLLIGLGMRESSGRYCEGRDTTADNVTADTAEAGLFQTSWNSHAASPMLPTLFTEYSDGRDGFVSVFQEGVACAHGDWANYGDGQGEDFQKLSKACPAFAAEFAALGLRVLRKHWGPINVREAELTSQADTLLKQVQSIVDAPLVA